MQSDQRGQADQFGLLHASTLVAAQMKLLSPSTPGAYCDVIWLLSTLRRRTRVVSYRFRSTLLKLVEAARASNVTITTATVRLKNQHTAYISLTDLAKPLPNLFVVLTGHGEANLTPPDRRCGQIGWHFGYFDSRPYHCDHYHRFTIRNAHMAR